MKYVESKIIADIFRINGLGDEIATLVNNENNVKVILNLLANSFLDLENNREGFESWIPFELSLFVEQERYEYLEENGATLTLYKIKNLICSFDKIVNEKYNKIERKSTRLKTNQ